MQQYGSKYFARRHIFDSRDGLKSIFFLKVVMLNIKLKGMQHRSPHKHLFCPFTHSQPPGVGQKVKTFFSESSQAAYQIKDICY